MTHSWNHEYFPLDGIVQIVDVNVYNASSAPKLFCIPAVVTSWEKYSYVLGFSRSPSLRALKFLTIQILFSLLKSKFKYLTYLE